MHEILAEEQGIKIGYSTLTRAMRRLGLSKGAQPVHAEHVPDVPGEEMQHDTTVYSVELGDHPSVKLVFSCLYLRYCKMRYVKFYRTFNRFVMKCFLDEALRFFGGCARICIIDNTSLVVHSGCGSEALFAPEMVAFANAYGFSWKAHALRHANRKAGNERAFRTIETSFLPGRRFTSLEDLNIQALQWATVQYAQRPQSHTGVIPAALFEQEKKLLRTLPQFISPPSLPHRRVVDAYGYIRFDRNFYWIGQAAKEVSIVQYADHIVIYAAPDKELIRYPLPVDGTEKQVFAPKEAPRSTTQPRNLKLGCNEQERLLREKGVEIGRYIDFIRSAQSTVRYKPQFIRKLYELSCTCDAGLFVAVVQRAIEYRVCSVEVLLRIAVQISTQQQSSKASDTLTLPLQQEYQNRQPYRQGEFSHENIADLSLLDAPPPPAEDNSDGTKSS
jgi:hypothetical protein